MAEEPNDSNLLGLTARIVSAHVANNPVEFRALPVLIRDIYKTLSHIDQAPAEPAEKPQPAVPIRKSVFPEALIGFRGGGMPHPTKPPTRAPSRALPRRRALCTN